MNLDVLVEQLQKIMGNPWMLTFLTVWAIGWLLKEKTDFNNNLIPWGIIVFAGALAWTVIERSVSGFLIGVIIGWMQIGFYEQIKGSIGYFREAEDREWR